MLISENYFLQCINIFDFRAKVPFGRNETPMRFASWIFRVTTLKFHRVVIFSLRAFSYAIPLWIYPPCCVRRISQNVVNRPFRRTHTRLHIKKEREKETTSGRAKADDKGLLLVAGKCERNCGRTVANHSAMLYPICVLTRPLLRGDRLASQGWSAHTLP